MLEFVLGFPVDHLALKAEDGRDYEELLRIFSRISTRVYETLINSRRISVAQLKSFVGLRFGDTSLGSTRLLEIMEPRPEKAGQDLVGFEHIELVVPQLEGVRQELMLRGSHFQEGGNDYHQTVVLKINDNGQEVKFTNRPLIAIIEEQIKRGETAVLKGGD